MTNFKLQEIWNQGFRLLTAVIILGLFLYINWPLLTPVLVAAIFAMAIHPVVTWLEVKTKRSKRFATGIALFGFSVLFLLPSISFFYRSTKLISNSNLQESPIQEKLVRLENFAQAQLQRISETTGYDLSLSKEAIQSSVEKVGNSLMQSVVAIFAELPAVVLATFIILVSMYFFLAESVYFREMLYKFTFLGREKTKTFIDLVKESCRAILVSNIIVGAVQATTVSLGALATGFHEFGVIWFLTFVVSFVPVIGAAPVALVLALTCFIDGRYGAGIALIVTSIVAGTIDNILRPYLISGRTEIHPLIGLLAVIGGVMVFGIAGLFFGPLIATLAIQGLPILLDFEDEVS